MIIRHNSGAVVAEGDGVVAGANCVGYVTAQVPKAGNKTFAVTLTDCANPGADVRVDKLLASDGYRDFDILYRAQVRNGRRRRGLSLRIGRWGTSPRTDERASAHSWRCWYGLAPSSHVSLGDWQAISLPIKKKVPSEQSEGTFFVSTNLWFAIQCDYTRRRRRAMPATPMRSKSPLVGSGTGSGTGDPELAVLYISPVTAALDTNSVYKSPESLSCFSAPVPQTIAYVPSRIDKFGGYDLLRQDRVRISVPGLFVWPGYAFA